MPSSSLSTPQLALCYRTVCRPNRRIFQAPSSIHYLDLRSRATWRAISTWPSCRLDDRYPESCSNFRSIARRLGQWGGWGGVGGWGGATIYLTALPVARGHILSVCADGHSDRGLCVGPTVSTTPSLLRGWTFWPRGGQKKRKNNSKEERKREVRGEWVAMRLVKLLGTGRERGRKGLRGGGDTRGSEKEVRGCV